MLQRPSKQLKGLGIEDPLQNLTDSEIATINKTRSIDAKANEKKDSERIYKPQWHTLTGKGTKLTPVRLLWQKKSGHFSTLMKHADAAFSKGNLSRWVVQPLWSMEMVMNG